MKKKYHNWLKENDSFTKLDEKLIHEQIHLIKSKSELKSNGFRIKSLIKAEKFIGKKLHGEILEVGSGNGYASVFIAKNRKIKKIFCSEVTKNGVDILIRKNFEQNMIPNNLYELVLSSFNKIPLKNKFDFIIAFGALHHSSNLLKSLDEIYSALKPGGYLIAQEPFSDDKTQNSVFIKRKQEVANVQGLIKIKNYLRDDNFYRKCEYLTSSFHSGFQDVQFYNLKKPLIQRLKELYSKKTSSNALIILKKGINHNEIPHRWI